MNELLHASAKHLAEYLGDILPQISPHDWWQTRVLDRLSDKQLSIISDRGIRGLHQLDLASLLQVLEKNWREVGYFQSLPFDSFNYLKEMRAVRNRWAHPPAGGVDPDDHYRDLDTLGRFLQAIDAEQSLLEQVKAAKGRLRTVPSLAATPVPPPTIPVAPAHPGVASAPAPGSLVSINAEPGKVGVITRILPGPPAERYVALVDNVQRTFYANQVSLQLENNYGPEIVDLATFHATVSALQLLHPSIANLYSLQAARIDPIPYQFRPVLKFLQADRPRLLIADDVGVGKTIEAGLILRELQARGPLERVMIACPKPLVSEKKWAQEMKRFDEEFTALDGPALRHCIEETDRDGVWPDKYNRVIVPFSILDADSFSGEGRRGNNRGRGKVLGLTDLDPPPHFDLLIVDEAHHVRNPNTKLYDNIRFLCEHADAVIFLTATPIQLGDEDLFHLLNLLRPDLIADRVSFEQMAAPNPFINRAVELVRAAAPGWLSEAQQALKQAADTAWGRVILSRHPDFQRVLAMPPAEEPSTEARVALVRELEQLHTFSALINRTRRRDIGTFTTRKPETVAIAFTPAQQAFHDALLEAQRTILAQAHGVRSVEFMLTTLRRQASSCIYGLAPFIRDVLNRRLTAFETLVWENAEEEFDIPDAALTEAKKQIEGVAELAEALDGDDPKLRALIELLRKKRDANNNKALLFSSFRHTLGYLHHHLAKEGFRLGLVQGDVPEEERRELRRRFSLPKDDPTALDVLLSSEVGCEGLDYQFCDCLINYDLPWNPMRVEQRIGRIDRYGQRSETVVIYNFVTEGTVDFDIYERCLLRIGIFRSALGGSEEVLGNLTRQLRDVAENLSLTEAERKERLQQLADNEVRQLQEQAALEDREHELFTVASTRAAQGVAELAHAASYWLHPGSLLNLVRKYLERVAETSDVLLGEGPQKTLRLSQEVRGKMLEDFRRLKRRTGCVARDWERYLKGSTPYLSVTFDAQLANQDRDVTQITPVHPLAQAAAQMLTPNGEIRTALRIESDSLPAGTYPFAIYKWQKFGIRTDVVFQPIAAAESLKNQLMALMPEASAHPEPDQVLPPPEEFAALEQHHFEAYEQARHLHREYVAQLATCRLQSLDTTYRAAVTQLREKIAKIENDKISRMRQSQLAAREEEYNRIRSEIETGIARADITADCVATGVLVVEKPDAD